MLAGPVEYSPEAPTDESALSFRLMRGISEKNSSASVTLMESTSEMDFSFVMHFERLAIVAFATADIACYINIGQKIHLDFFHAVAFTGFATPTFDIKSKNRPTLYPRIFDSGSDAKIADVGEKSGIGRRIRALRAADRGLIDLDHFIKGVQSLGSF